MHDIDPNDEPVWPRMAYSEGRGAMAPCHAMPVTIFAIYEGMRLQLKFLPYEAAYEEVIRRCELALGGVRLPPGVWLSCKGCGRRLSLCNNPQRRMPGQCHPEEGAWEWNVNVPFMAFISQHADGVTDAKPLRVPSKNELIEDLSRVAVRTLGLGYIAAALSFNGEILPDESTVEKCGIAEGDHLVLILRWQLIAIRGSGDHRTEISCQIFGHMAIKELFRSLLENGLFHSFSQVLLEEKCIWQLGDDDSQTLKQLGIKDNDTVRIFQKEEHETPSALQANYGTSRRSGANRVNSSAQTDDLEHGDGNEMVQSEEEEEVDYS